MPLIESKPDAVAIVYAQALYDLAEKSGGQAAIESTLGELEGLMDLARTDKRFNEFLASRIIGTDQRSASIGAMLSGKVSDRTVRFLQVLNKKGRLTALPGIVEAFDSIAQMGFGRVEVDVTTATPLSESDLAQITVSLRERLGKEPVVRTTVEPAMLGGIRFQIGDRLIDASLSTRLSQVRTAIIEQGLPAVRSASERLFKVGSASMNGHERP